LAVWLVDLIHVSWIRVHSVCCTVCEFESKWFKWNC